MLIWAGLRGALSMVLVLSLPDDFAFRNELVRMTFGTVLLSILIQGLSMKPLLSRLGLSGANADSKLMLARARGHWAAASADLRQLPALRGDALFEALARHVDAALVPADDEAD